MDKVTRKKQEKENRLIETAFDLFISKGINETTIQDIVNEAGVGKGTFYLYFKDKYEIVEKIIFIKTVKLFEDAIESSHNQKYTNFTEQFLHIIDYIIDDLTQNQQLLKFIYKNLSAAIHTVSPESSNEESAMKALSKSFYDLFSLRTKEDNLNLKDPKVTFFMIIELVGSTCYNSILYEWPLPIALYKPHLYEAIQKLLQH